MNSPHCPKYEEYSELIRLSLGWDMPVEKLKEIAERIYTTERLMLGKLGVGSRKDDYPPECWFTEGPEWARFDKDKYETFLDEYYQLHGWGADGIPTTQLVEKLGITEATLK